MAGLSDAAFTFLLMISAIVAAIPTTADANRSVSKEFVITPSSLNKNIFNPRSRKIRQCCLPAFRANRFPTERPDFVFNRDNGYEWS
jgi:hypothetical protein